MLNLKNLIVYPLPLCGCINVLFVSTLLMSNFMQMSNGFPQTQTHDTVLSAYRNANYKSTCLDTKTGRELYIGESFTRAGQCISVQCLGTLDIWEDRCQIPTLEGNCARLPSGNEFLDYPRCCPTYQCRSYKTDENGNTDETRTYDHYGRLLREHITQSLKVLIPPPTTPPNAGYQQQYPRYSQQPNVPVTQSRFEVKYK